MKVERVIVADGDAFAELALGDEHACEQHLNHAEPALEPEQGVAQRAAILEELLSLPVD